MNEQQEREAFEAQHRKFDLRPSILSSRYADQHTDERWLGWLARAALAHPPVEAASPEYQAGFNRALELTLPKATQEDQAALRGNSGALARRFHEAYERLAPRFGYVTRPETRKFDAATPNGALMIAVCAELFADTQPSSHGSEPSRGKCIHGCKIETATCGCFAQAHPKASTGELPPLPEPHINNVPQLEDENWHGYTADQMHAYARQAIEQAGSEPLTEHAIGLLEYKGNSVCYIKDKATAYARAIDRAWDAMRAAGFHPDGNTPLADAIAAAIRQQSAEGGKASKTIVTNGDEVEVVHADGDGVVRRVD